MLNYLHLQMVLYYTEEIPKLHRKVLEMSNNFRKVKRKKIKL